MTQIFISYSRSDFGIVKRVDHKLQEAGFSTWTDQELIAGTADWAKSIEKSITECDAIVVLLSPESNKSRWVQREITFAQAMAKPVFPILISGNMQSAVPISLLKYQYLDIRESFQEGMSKLVSVLENRFSKTEPTVLSVKVPKSPTEAKRHIFLSYSRKDMDYMLKTLNILEKSEISVWVDRKRVRVGTSNYAKKIEEAIGKSIAIVVLCTPNSKQSDWVIRESLYAEQSGKPIYPLLVNGEILSAIPIQLIATQALDVRNGLEPIRTELVPELKLLF